MATYANATNPFIETPAESSSNLNPNKLNSCNDFIMNHQVIKSVPGMAQPKSPLEERDRSNIKIKRNLMFIDNNDKDGHETEVPNDIKSQIIELNNNCHQNLKRDDKEKHTGKKEENISFNDNAKHSELDVEISSCMDSLLELAVTISKKPPDSTEEEETSDEQGDKDNYKEVLLPARMADQQGITLQSPKDIESCTDPIKCSGCELAGKKEDVNDCHDNHNSPSDYSDKIEEDDQATPTKLADQSNGRRQQHIELIKKLRLQLRDLERYAYERGELEQVPPTVLAERHNVILETLKKKLPLNIDQDKIEKLELEELKRQVDNEINNLIDPLLTKEHLLNQLKTQLTDLERYISHLHGSLGKTELNDRKYDCQCPKHGCSSSTYNISPQPSSPASSSYSQSPTLSASKSLNNNVLNSETLPKTSRLIRGLMAQLICSDIKIQEAMRMNKDYNKFKGEDAKSAQTHNPKGQTGKGQSQLFDGSQNSMNVTTKPPQFHDGAAWTLHIDRVVLATDSLTNLFSLTPKKERRNEGLQTQLHQLIDQSLVESVVRRQLVPAIKDLLSYGLVDPSSLPPRSTYATFLFDPYYLLSSLTCLPGSQVKSESSQEGPSLIDKVHVWNVIEDYYNSRNESNFRTSSVKTLSQSFNLTPSLDGPIKITSKQALLIATDDIIERLTKSKPNGPESHFRLFVYTALNQGKLATWIKIIFKNKSIQKKYYHSFSFVSQFEKIDKFLSIIEALNSCKFNIDIDRGYNDQFVSAF